MGIVLSGKGMKSNNKSLWQKLKDACCVEEGKEGLKRNKKRKSIK